MSLTSSFLPFFFFCFLHRQTTHTFFLLRQAQCVDIIKWLTYFCLHTKTYQHVYIVCGESVRHIKRLYVERMDLEKVPRKNLCFSPHPTKAKHTPRLSLPLHGEGKGKKKKKKKNPLMILVVVEVWGWIVEKFHKKKRESEESKKKKIPSSFLPFTDKVYIRCIHECVYIILTQLLHFLTAVGVRRTRKKKLLAGNMKSHYRFSNFPIPSFSSSPRCFFIRARQDKRERI